MAVTPFPWDSVITGAFNAFSAGQDRRAQDRRLEREWRRRQAAAQMGMDAADPYLKGNLHDYQDAGNVTHLQLARVNKADPLIAAQSEQARGSILRDFARESATARMKYAPQSSMLSSVMRHLREASTRALNQNAMDTVLAQQQYRQNNLTNAMSALNSRSNMSAPGLSLYNASLGRYAGVG